MAKKSKDIIFITPPTPHDWPKHLYDWSTEQDTDGWIAHDGSECPVDGDTVVEVKFKNNEWVRATASKLDWLNTRKDDLDIIAYRIVQPARPVAVSKLPYHLVPSDALEEIIKVLEFGEVKHADNIWPKDMPWSRNFSACMRHLWKWWRGEHIDSETGLSHLAHAGCRILFLIAYELRKTGKDDRCL